MSAKFKPGDLLVTTCGMHIAKLGPMDAQLSLHEIFHRSTATEIDYETRTLIIPTETIFVLVECGYNDSQVRMTYQVRLLHPEHGPCAISLYKLEPYFELVAES